MSTSFAHIINTISPSDNPSLFRAQEFTVRTMLAAQKNAAHLKIALLSAQFSNAVTVVPPGFTATKNLEACAADRKDLQTMKRFPLLKEILVRLKESDAEYFIYSNLDICVMPFFYSSVALLIEKGHDAVVINRRRIPGKLLEEKNLELHYAEAGETHTGYDCFIFSRALLDKFILRDIFVGTPPSGNDLFYNLFTFAENPVLLPEKHLTFHIGMDLVKSWGDPVLNAHNKKEFRALLKELSPLFDVAKFPGAGYGFFKRHFKWLMNPTFHYPTMLALDFRQLGRKRRKPAANELKGLRNRYFEWMIRKINFRDGD